MMMSIVLFAASIICMDVAAILLNVRWRGYRTRVQGPSMEPTIKDGEAVWMIRYGRSQHPRRYDIVSVDMGDQTLIKRIVGLPGETVQVMDGELYIDGERLGWYAERTRMYNGGRLTEAVTLGDDEYIVLGDNRNHSADSRAFGPVKRQQLLGYAKMPDVCTDRTSRRKELRRLIDATYRLCGYRGSGERRRRP